MTMIQENAITFGAEFKKVTTTIDGGWSLTLHMDNSEASKMMLLSQLRDQYLQIAVAPFPKVGDECNAV